MASPRYTHQPTLKRLLASEAMAEAQVACGSDLLERPLTQVVTSLTPVPRTGSLLVTRSLTFSSQDLSCLPSLAGLVWVKPYSNPGEATVAVSSTAAKKLPPAAVEVQVDLAVKLCSDAGIPLVIMPGYGDPTQSAEDIRLTFVQELKRSNNRLHAHFVSQVLELGLTGLLQEVSLCIDRPVAVETSDFKILATHNMGGTPAGQQRAVAEEVSAWLKRQQICDEDKDRQVLSAALKVGRRLVVPVVLNGALQGYLSAMLRTGDDLETLAEYMQPAALAVMVDFSQRQKGISAFTVTQKSLLKDLLSGRTLSAADQERLEQHFGFDICDGISVFAVKIIAGQKNTPIYPEDLFIATEVEGTRIFVVTHQAESGRTWQQESEVLVAASKELSPNCKVQLGASRLIQSALDLPDAYREARQALIVGSMIHGDNEFVTGYGDLGVRRLLYLIVDHPEIDRFYESHLAPLEAYDAEWESELVPTLQVYLDQGANLNSAARELFVHRHTLRYRLEQIAEILNVDIDSQEVLLNLQIAFLIKEMKGKSIS